MVEVDGGGMETGSTRRCVRCGGVEVAGGGVEVAGGVEGAGGGVEVAGGKVEVGSTEWGMIPTAAPPASATFPSLPPAGASLPIPLLLLISWPLPTATSH